MIISFSFLKLGLCLLKLLAFPVVWLLSRHPEHRERARSETKKPHRSDDQ